MHICVESVLQNQLLCVQYSVLFMFDTACVLDLTDSTGCAGVANRLGLVAHKHHFSHGDGSIG